MSRRGRREGLRHHRDGARAAETPSQEVGSIALRAFDDWKDIWKNAVQLHQEWSLRARGAAHKGGLGTKLDALVAVMPVYRRMVLDGFDLPSAHRQEQLANGPAAELDDSTVRHHIEEIDRLLAPTAAE